MPKAFPVTCLTYSISLFATPFINYFVESLKLSNKFGDTSLITFGGLDILRTKNGSDVKNLCTIDMDIFIKFSYFYKNI